MNSVRQLQIFEKFIEKARTYNWTTRDGRHYNYENEHLQFDLSNYSLRITYKNVSDGNDSGYEFSTDSNHSLKMFYSELCSNRLSTCLNKIADSEPEIKRELGLEDLLS